MRIPIKIQLAALVLLGALVCLAIVAIATWVTTSKQILTLRNSRFLTIASLKAAQLSSNLDLMERSVRTLATRVKVQNALARYNHGDNTPGNWLAVTQDLRSGLSGAQEQLLTLQTILFSRDNLGGGNLDGLVNITGDEVNVQLPYRHKDGSHVQLGDRGWGYPPNLYPNLTYHRDTSSTGSSASFKGRPLGPQSSILLGPWLLNSTFALCSITLPIINNTSYSNIIGYITVVLDARLILDVVYSPIGLGETGTVLLIGPDTMDNQFTGASEMTASQAIATQASRESTKIRMVVPPDETRYAPNRHPYRSFNGHPEAPFKFSSFSALAHGLVDNRHEINNAGADINCYNEQHFHVAIGYAVPQSRLCSWTVIFEQSFSEAQAVIYTLRNTLLATVFGTAGGMLLIILPLAHYGSRPIRRLRDATITTSRPVPDSYAPEKSPDPSQSSPSDMLANELSKDNSKARVKEKERTWTTWHKLRPSLPSRVFSYSSQQRLEQAEQTDPETGSTTRVFRVPGKVSYKRFWIEDELTDLMQKFNEMSDELFAQYTKLEERVRQRTAELEVSKRAAEAADQAKTQLVANVSHELRSPLNAILGMCTVCLQEDDPSTIKRSLQIIYKSGDLLHTLLTDLLTFSKNQAGKGLSLDQKEFRLRDIGVQIQAIFQNQASEAGTSLFISYLGQWDVSGNICSVDLGEYGPLTSGKVRDFCLWGDNQRVLQVVINLVSNGLKFTPKGGSVHLRVKCLPWDGVPSITRKESGLSFKSDKRHIKHPNGPISDPSEFRKPGETPQDPTLPLRERHSFASADSDDRAEPPPNASTLMFEFEVTDTGPGIPHHLQSRIFEPFVQGDLRLTKKFGGTGLGLSICAQLAKLLGGVIDLESTVGVGSKFVLKIPLKLCGSRLDSAATSTKRMSISSMESPLKTGKVSEGDGVESPGATTFEADSKPRLVGLSQPYFSTASSPLASPNNEHAKKNKLKVLVAEDNKVNQEVVLRMLKLEEIFDVHIAKDGQEALDFVKLSMEQKSPYDLIFMDVQMPNLDGRESTRLIRQIGYSAPIVALTAFADESNQKECMESGMDYFLAKPIKRPALKHVIRTYCAPIEEADETEKELSRSAEASPITRETPTLEKGEMPPLPGNS